MSAAIASLWIACFLLTYTFPNFNSRLGSAGTFRLYAAVCVAGFIFILVKLPETKGRPWSSLEPDLVDKDEIVAGGCSRSR